LTLALLISTSEFAFVRFHSAAHRTSSFHQPGVIAMRSTNVFELLGSALLSVTIVTAIALVFEYGYNV
jgi:hypothetical protein